MSKQLKYKQVIVHGIIGFFMLSGHAYAQNSGYVSASIQDEYTKQRNVERQKAPKMVEQDPSQLITGANYDYIGEGKYTLGVNDVISISVMRHPEVSGEYTVNKEGKIQYGFVGDIFIVGLDKNQVKELVSQKISEYIVSPDVTVTISGYYSKVVYVIGEVASPGKIYMKGDTITVREALIEANLPLLSAKGSKSTLITPTGDGEPKIKRIDVDRLLYKGDLRENYVMKPGDTLYLPPTIMAKAMRVIQPVAAPIGTSAGTARTVTTGF